MTMAVENAKTAYLQGSTGQQKDNGEAPVFEAVGNRCAFVAKWSPDMEESSRLVLALKRAGLGIQEVDPVDELRVLIRRPWQADLHLKLRTSERAAQWAYGRKGVRIPRTALEQLECGEPIVFDEIERGDLVFARPNGVTHLLGLATGNGSLIGVPRDRGGAVAEITAAELSSYRQLTARRPISRELNVVTILSRSESEIFNSRDIDRLLFYLDR